MSDLTTLSVMLDGGVEGRLFLSGRIWTLSLPDPGADRGSTRTFASLEAAVEALQRLEASP